MSVSREMMLARIRSANGGASRRGAADVDAEYAALPRLYRLAHHDPAGQDMVALFADRAADYRATVERAAPGDIATAVAVALERRAAAVAAAVPAPSDRSLAEGPWFAVPPGLPDAWLAECSVPAVADEPPVSVDDLDKAAGVVTGCAVAIAETGTIVLDHGPGQGRRALSLVPDFHLVVVRAQQIEADLSGALDRVDPRRPHTFISGPSATSDIELIRVEGVHGPRNLHILIAG